MQCPWWGRPAVAAGRTEARRRPDGDGLPFHRGPTTWNALPPEKHSLTLRMLLAEIQG